ncbi:TadE/TadG family type IV pilus assembly protein [Labedella endophytica]|uniref:TadE/TadG family type IV pilus assembly protein n=1 Tax=Labedella endophytica TaxID=1523160 RepID=UPI002442877B|nr:TadE/TadG family type IV pilus assembly protein [Labedella endophytica]
MIGRRFRRHSALPAAVSTERGSAVVENLLVTILLTTLALAVVQLALALHVRTTVSDAASEGARFGALAGRGPDDAVSRTRALIDAAIGDGYATSIEAEYTDYRGHAAMTVTVDGVLPVIGLLGVGEGLHADGRAAVETVDD